jgi:Septum formation/Domain of unknown function (DUF4190)
MTVPPPQDPGFPPPWNRPSAGTAWSTDEPPAGLPPQGYPNQGYPQQGYPAAGYPPPYPAPGYPGQPVRQGTNGFAIAALIFGIIGGVLLGFIFGFIALSQIKKSGQGGRGMALAGLILSGLWTLLIIGIIIAAVASSPSRDDSGQITSGGSVSATALKPGDCVNNLRDSTSLLSLPAVPCSQAHEGEVFAVFDLPSGPYPGAVTVEDRVTTECTARLAAYSPSAGSDGSYGLYSVFPREQNWKAGDREVACLAQALSGPSTGSIKGR